MRVRIDRATVVAAFATFAVFWGAWGAVVPQIQRAAHVSSGTLGLDLLLIGVGALCSMQFAGTLIDRLGALVLPASMVALALTGILPALARSGVTLGVALFVVGIASGALDVAINTAGARSEARTGLPIMNLAHAGFSIGVVVTSLSAGLALDRGATSLVVLIGCGLATGVVAAILMLLRRATAWGQPVPPTAPTPPAAPSVRAQHPPEGLRKWRRRISRIPVPLLILGGICGLSYFIEGAWQNWGALHIERTFAGSPALGAAAPAGFALAAATGRLLAHRVSHHLTPRSLLQSGAAIAAAGTVLAAAAPSATVALAGICIAGLGTSICAPTVFSLTGQVAGPANRGAAMGTVTTIAYAGFIVGPALVGILASAFNLRLALGLVGVVAVSLGLVGAKAPMRASLAESSAPPWPAA
jgi:MFS family permease